MLDDLDGQVDLILDGGATMVGVESTVLDLSQERPKILRHGGVPCEAIEALIGPIDIHDLQMVAPGPQISPGMLDNHYAPHARLILCSGFTQAALAKIKRVASSYLENGLRVGFLLADEDRPYFQSWDGTAVYLGVAAGLSQVARKLYAGMRSLDQAGVDLILARDYPQHGLGLAVNDRLSRAASEIFPSVE